MNAFVKKLCSIKLSVLFILKQINLKYFIFVEKRKIGKKTIAKFPLPTFYKAL